MPLLLLSQGGLTAAGQLEAPGTVVIACADESFTVMAPTMYEAAVELTEQVGFDLEDG